MAQRSPLRSTDPSDIEIVPLGPSSADAVLDFFDHDAFPGRPEWAACYCIFPLMDPADWGGRRAAENRAELIERMASGRIGAQVAVVGERVVGWVNAGPRSLVPTASGRSDDLPDEQVGSIQCFVMAPEVRGQGLRRRLLDAAVEGFRSEGMAAVEGYPPKEVTDPGGAFPGTVGLYEAAGFQPVAERGTRVVMRLPL